MGDLRPWRNVGRFSSRGSGMRGVPRLPNEESRRRGCSPQNKTDGRAEKLRSQYAKARQGFINLDFVVYLRPPPPVSTAIAPAAESTFFKYGLEWDADWTPLSIELHCYKIGHSEAKGGLGPVGHFKEAANLLWGPDNEQKKFLWHPWADTMLEESIRWKFLSVSGCASAGKSDFYAIYAIINWLADPANTSVMITSTSLTDSRGRIWGSVEEYWNAAQKHCGGALPGKLVSSIGLIKLDDPTGEFKTSDRSSIRLVAGEKKKAADTIGKLIGFKNKRVFFIADELPELSAAILEAAFGNLDANPFFQLIGIGNPNSIYDPHGVFSRPEGGWKLVNPSMDEWKTEKGYAIRFDAYKSPNVLAGRVIYPWLPTQAKIDAKKKELGEDSLAFWRMWRAYWCPTGGSESVISEADIVGFDCESTKVTWRPGSMIELSFLDPGFTNGGDRSVLYFAQFGFNEDTQKWTLLFTDYEVLFENTMDKKVSRNYQIVRQFKAKCEARKLLPKHCGFDDTGAAAFGDIVHEEWTKEVRRVNFGGGASKTPISANDKTLASDKYKNRVTEIWTSLREFIRGNQIRGICADLGVELTARKMVHVKSASELKASVESKEMMRDRTGKSPDIADAALGILDILRRFHHFKATARVERSIKTNGGWVKFRRNLSKRFAGPAMDREHTHHGAILDRAV